MTDAIRPLIAGNWKMNGLKSSVAEFEAMLAGASAVALKADLLVCPPVTLLDTFAEKARGSKTLSLGAQDCHPRPSGAHTGDISAEMLADAGARAVIVGHSERRPEHGGNNELIAEKGHGVLGGGGPARIVRGENPDAPAEGPKVGECHPPHGGFAPDGR